MTHGGGSRRSGSPATNLSRRAVSRSVLHLFPLRSRKRYCSSGCREEASRRQRRCANTRHQQSPEGWLDHRDRQGEYRRRQARVTDQGSLSITSPASFECGTSKANAGVATIPPPQPAPFTRLRCCICGRTGRFIDPYPRIPRRRWLPS